MPATQQLREHNYGRSARRLAAYLPSTLVAQILNEGLPPAGEGRSLMAAALFCDISGFATMAGALAAAGPDGAEQLNRILLMTFTPLINAINQSGGAVTHFHGDAMMVYFPDDDGKAAGRALACAQFMQSLVQTGYSRVVTKAGSIERDFELSMKIGVGYGICLETIVGDPGQSLEFVVGGPAISEAVAAQERALAGQVIASQNVLRRHGVATKAPFSLFQNVLPVPDALPLLNWGMQDLASLQRLAETVAAFIHPALYQRISGEGSNFVAEHRPVTTMFVHFTGIDFLADDAAAKLNEYYNWACAIIARFGGHNSRLNRLLTGDKGDQLHIVFGAPVAPDAPVQALRCALALQREKPDFIASQHIGITSGLVFACAVGSPSRREYTVVGDLVILSSRLTHICPAGGVLIDEGTARRCEEQFTLTDVAKRHFKGFAVPVTFYGVTAERRTVSRIQSRYGSDMGPVLTVRQRELDQLQACLNAAAAGQGQIVTVFGPAGSGRSRLMAAGVRQWQADHGVALVGIGQRHLSETPYGAWLPIWRDFFELPPDMEAALQVDLVVQRIWSLNPDGLAYVSLWLERLGLPTPPAYKLPEGLSGAARQAHLFVLIRIILTRAAQQGPLLLVIEDIHWADGQSVALLNYLAGWWRKMAIGIGLTATHSDNEPIEIGGNMRATWIELGALSAADGRQLVKNLLDEPVIPKALFDHLGLADDEARVLPLFLEESVAMLRQMGLLRREPTGLVFDAEGQRQMQIPTTIQNLLLARLDRVSAPARALLQAAAVSGRQFEQRLLIDLLPEMTPAAVEVALTELLRAQVIRLVHDGTNPTFLFQSDMMREVTYQSAPYARRQLLHEAVAVSLLNKHQFNLRAYYAVLAYHYSFTDQHSAGLRYALAAGDDGRAAFAGHAAVEMYNQALHHLVALNLPNQWQTEVYIYLMRAEVRQLLAEYDAAAADAAAAGRIARDHNNLSSLVRAQNLTAALALRQAPAERVFALTDEVIDQPAGAVYAAELGYAWLTRAEAFAYLGQMDETIAALATAHRFFSEKHHRRGLMRVQLALAQDYYIHAGKWVEAQRHFEAALQLMAGHRENYPEERIRAYLGLAEIACHLEDLKAAEEFLRKAEGLFTVQTHRWWRAAYVYWQGNVARARGQLEEARASWHAGVRAIAEGSSPDMLPLILLALAETAPDAAARENWFRQCLAAARARARHCDQLRCARAAAEAGLADLL